MTQPQLQLGQPNQFLFHEEPPLVSHMPNQSDSVDVRGTAWWWTTAKLFYHRRLGSVQALMAFVAVIVYAMPVAIWIILRKMDCLVEVDCEHEMSFGWGHIFGESPRICS